MRIAVTGHANIESCFGLQAPRGGDLYEPTAWKRVYDDVAGYLRHDVCAGQGVALEEVTLISGMARGVDEVVALVAIREGLGLIAAVPGSVGWHRGRPPSRGIRAQAVAYEKILRYPRLEVREIGKDYGGAGRFRFVNFARNQAMVDLADKVFSWKMRDSTGTDDCVRRAGVAAKFLGNAAGWAERRALGGPQGGAR